MRARTAGATIGNALLLALIALGLGWNLRTSAEVFDYLRWIGAAYLVWLGIQAWRYAGEQREALAPHVHTWRSFVVAMTNPRSIAFFTALLPQFIDPMLPVERQLLVMCTVSVTVGAFLDSGWAIAAGLSRAWFTKPKHNRVLGLLSGLVLMCGGVWLSFARRSG